MPTYPHVERFIKALNDLTDPTSAMELANISSAYDQLGSTPCTAEAAEAILSTFQRFPNSDGFEVFDTLRLYTETCETIDTILLRSLQAQPTEMATATLVRIYNTGQRKLDNFDIVDIMQTIAQRSDSPAAARVALRFIKRKRD